MWKLPLALACLLVLSLAACSSAPEKPDEAPQAQPADDAVDEPAPAEAPKSAAPAYTAADAPPDDHGLFVGYDHWNRGEYDKAIEMFADDAVWQSSFRPGQPFEGKEAILAAWKAWAPLQPAIAAKRIFTFRGPEGDVMVVEGVIAGKHAAEFQGKPPTGKKFGVSYAHVMWFNADQKITKYLAIFNGMAMPMQLGLMPSEKPVPVVSLPLRDTEMVAGAGVEARRATYEALLNKWAEGTTYNSGEVLADNVTYRWHSVEAAVEGKDAATAAEEPSWRAFGDLDLSELHVVAAGDYLVAFGKLSGTHAGDLGPYKASGKPFSASVVSVARYEGDKVVEVDVYTDPMEVHHQLAEPGATTSMR